MLKMLQMTQDKKLKAFELIDQVISDNKSNINEFDTIQGFFDSIRKSLRNSEYVKTLNATEEELCNAFELLEQFEDHKDLLIDMVLKGFLAK